MRRFREHLWIVAYDTPSDRRRRKLARLLEGYGTRVQWSVFECRLREDEVKVLVGRLSRLIHAGEDSVRLWPLPESSSARIQQLGRAQTATTWSDLII